MSRVPRSALLLAALLSLAACSGGDEERDDSASTGLNVTANATAPANTIETAPAVAPAPPELTAAERRAAARNVRDGEGEARGPEYEGARSAATALPSEGDDATTTDAVPPPPPAAPGTPQNATTER